MTKNKLVIVDKNNKPTEEERKVELWLEYDEDGDVALKMSIDGKSDVVAMVFQSNLECHYYDDGVESKLPEIHWY